MDICLIFNKPNPQSIQLNILQTLRPKRYFKQQCPMNTLLSYVLNILFVFSTLTTSEASGEKNNLPLPFPISFVSYKWYDNTGEENPKRNENNGEYQPPLCPNNDQLTRKYYCDKSRVSTLSPEQYAKLELIIETIRTRGKVCRDLSNIGSLLLSQKGIVVAKIDPKDRVKHEVWAFVKTPKTPPFFSNEGELLYLENAFITLDPAILEDQQIGHYESKVALEWVLVHQLDHVLLQSEKHIPLVFGLDTSHINFTIMTENINSCISTPKNKD